MLNAVPVSRAMLVGLSCLLHVGYTVDGGRTLSSVHVLSSAIKAYMPDVRLAPDGSFLVAWHEEQFPLLKTVVQPLRIPRAR